MAEDPGTGLAGSAPPKSPKMSFELIVVAGLLLALLMGALDQFVVLTALPTILTQFGSPDSGSFVISAYIIASTTGIPIFAKLSDIWSRRNVFLAGLVLFMAGSVLAGLSQNLPELIAFRAVQGFGSGDFFPVGVAIVAVIFPPETRTRIVGFLSGVFGIATVAGPVIGSFIVDNTTWRWVFYVNIPIGLVGLAIVLATLGPLRPEQVRRYDVLGTGLLAGWVAAIMFPLYQISGNGWSWTDPRALGLFALGAVLVLVFLYWEYRAENPLLPLRLLAHRAVGAGGAATFFIGMMFFPVATFLSLVVGVVLSHGASSADIVRDVLYALVIPVVLGAATGGQLLTRLSYRAVALVGIAFAILGLVFLTQITPSTPTWRFAFGFLPVGGVVLPLLPLGFGTGLTFPVFLLAAQNEVPVKDVGEAGGLIQFLQSLGGAVGLSVLASFEATRFAALDPSPAASCATSAPPLPLCGPYLSQLSSSLISAYDQTFSVMVGLLVVAFVWAWFVTGRVPTANRGVKPTVETPTVSGVAEP